MSESVSERVSVCLCVCVRARVCVCDSLVHTLYTSFARLQSQILDVYGTFAYS